MSIQSLRQLQKSITREGQLEAALALLSELGFRTTSWQPGSVQRTLVTALSYLTADVAGIVSVVAENALDTDASEDWLDVVSTFYGHTRGAAKAATGPVTLTLAGGSPPATWGAGELILSADAVNLGEPLYRVVEAGSLAAGASGTYTIQAVTTGTAGNIVAQPLSFVTPVTGMSASLINEPTTGTWLASPGTDLESDSRLRERNQLKWSQLAYGANRDAYRLWALEADSSVTRVGVSADGSGAVSIYCATATGATSAAQNAAIQAYVDARHPLDDVPTVFSAAVFDVAVEIAPTIVRGTTTTLDIESAIVGYFGQLPIGGLVVAPSSVGQVIRDEMIERVMALPGVRRANIVTPSGNVSLSPHQIPVAKVSITPTLVAT